MGKNRYPGSFTQRDQAPPVPFVMGVQELKPDGPNTWLIERLYCNACAHEAGLDTPSGREGTRWEVCYDDEGIRGEHCTTCGREFWDQLPLRCPKCGQTGCFNARVLAWTHLGPTADTPHGDVWLEDDWTETVAYNAQLIACQECGYQSDDHGDFWPPLAAERSAEVAG